MPRGEYGSRYGELPREERLKDALQTLEHGIDSILTSEDFAAYLKSLARFHHYSFGNVLLIRMQQPDASQVAGYRRWQELGRQVKKGEQGIKILVPHTRKISRETEDEQDDVVCVSRRRGKSSSRHVSAPRQCIVCHRMNAHGLTSLIRAA